MADWIWNKKKPVINDLIRNIDASIQYYEAQHVYNGRLKGVDDMQKIYNKNIIEEKDKLMDKKNIFSSNFYQPLVRNPTSIIIIF